AGSGIGRAIAHGFAKEGATSVIAELRSDAGENVAEEIKKEGGKALAIKTDVANREEVLAMVKKVKDECGKVDILVNNAALTTMSFNHFHELKPEEWEREIAVDWIGVLNCCHAVIPHMIEQKWGKIVSITSDASKISTPRQSVYSGNKAAIAGFSRTIAGELARFGINVNCVAPGTVNTPATQGLGGIIEKMIKGVPKRRLAEPEEIAGVVMFLCSKEADYMTGQHISVSGGMTMH
ncbi:MAG: 3-oxoacyl-ACP reductase family protein, partial [Thermodesulfobacteriota bacterium]|nr:3-oxoacyl-ACP reductase family protein [Thermodesulfobacteriota bacterium]